MYISISLPVLQDWQSVFSLAHHSKGSESGSFAGLLRYSCISLLICSVGLNASSGPPARSLSTTLARMAPNPFFFFGGGGASSLTVPMNDFNYFRTFSLYLCKCLLFILKIPCSKLWIQESVHIIKLWNAIDVSSLQVICNRLISFTRAHSASVLASQKFLQNVVQQRANCWHCDIFFTRQGICESGERLKNWRNSFQSGEITVWWHAMPVLVILCKHCTQCLLLLQYPCNHGLGWTPPGCNILEEQEY